MSPAHADLLGTDPFTVRRWLATSSGRGDAQFEPGGRRAVSRRSDADKPVPQPRFVAPDPFRLEPRSARAGTVFQAVWLQTPTISGGASGAVQQPGPRRHP